jgi:hypothetical protein
MNFKILICTKHSITLLIQKNKHYVQLYFNEFVIMVGYDFEIKILLNFSSKI